MRQFPYVLFLGALVTGLASAGGSAPVAPKGVLVKVEQVGPAPYPFQAVRVRLTVQNVGKEPIGPLISPELVLRAPKIKKGGEQAYRQTTGTVLTRDPRELMGCGPRPGLIPFTLDPGEQISVSVAVAAEWSRDGVVLSGRPLFPEPAQYSLKFPYIVGVELEAEVTIAVQQPQGADKAVFDLLAKDPELASALMAPVGIPDKAQAAKLKDLADRFPNSSYAHYAGFALARFRLAQGGADYRNQETLGVAELLKLAYEPFAYRPHVLLALRPYPIMKEGVETLLQALFLDAAEYLDKGGPPARSAEEWVALRKRFAKQLEEWAKFPPAP